MIWGFLALALVYLALETPGSRSWVLKLHIPA